MPIVAQESRVAYVVSSDLIHFSDLLPSNPGRSSLVHSLAYHLDLLDLSLLYNKADSDTSGCSEPTISEEYTKLLRALHADSGAGVQGDASSHRRKALVYEPRIATQSQLTAYHQTEYIKQLSKKQRNASRKRAKRNSPGSDANSGASDSSEASLPHVVPDSVQDVNGKVAATNVNNQFGLQDDCPTFEGLGDHVALIAGAAITAAELIATGEADVAIAWDGGRHHAKKDSASGFCYVNDAVLAILALRKPRKVTVSATILNDDQSTSALHKSVIKRIDRVLYIDLDLHWGDGVEEAFYTSSNVLTLSIHHYAPGFFPCYAASSDPEKHGAPGSLMSEGGIGSKSISIPLGLGTSDASLERVTASVFQPLYELWNPEVVVVQCGVDGLAEDPMNVWNLSTSAYVRSIQAILAWRKPTILLGGGGYKSENAARCWSLLTAACLGRLDEEPTTRSPAKTTQTTLPLTSQASPTDQAKEAATNASCSNLDFISGKTLIPDHTHWPHYEPEYTLEVRAGERIDQNDEVHFANIQKQMRHHMHVISSARKA